MFKLNYFDQVTHRLDVMSFHCTCVAYSGAIEFRALCLCLSLTLSLSLSHTHTHTVSLSLSLTHIHCLSLSLTLTLSRSHSITLFLTNPLFFLFLLISDFHFVTAQPACLAQSPQLYKQMACACGGLDRSVQCSEGCHVQSNVMQQCDLFSTPFPLSLLHSPISTLLILHFTECLRSDQCSEQKTATPTDICASSLGLTSKWQS